MHRLIALAVCFLGCAAPVHGDRPPYTAEQLSLIRKVSECKLSPDGKTVAFVTDITGALELWTVPADGGWPTQLSNLSEQVTNIEWSPDGKWVLFTSDYGGNERRDLYRVPGSGGAVEKITETKITESQPKFSPDGKKIAFVADPDRDFLFQLHVMDLEGRKTTQLTKEPVNVQYPVWSPDGKTIAVTRSGDDQKGELLLVDAASGTKVVVEPTVKDGIWWAADFAADGKALLLTGPNKEGFAQMALLKVTNRKPEGKPEFFGPSNWDVTEAKWSQSGEIFFLTNESGWTRFKSISDPRINPKAEATRIDLWGAGGYFSQLSIQPGRSRVCLVVESVTAPGDIHIWDKEGIKVPAPGAMLEVWQHSWQVTHSLMGGVQSDQLSTGEVVAYDSFDKKKIHALFIKPKTNRLGSPPPAVVHVHGGPNGQTQMAFNPFLQLLAEQGIAVISPNYRGSTGYGKAFEDANNKDWGGGDLKDLVAAVEFFGKRGDIDPKRVGITGGSYGGYMTLMALSKTPKVWKCGVERYGMPDLVIDYLLSISRFGDWYETEMGSPKTHPDLFRDRSPMPFLNDIQAPLLIFQGAGDTNVPRSESDILVAVLRELKKPHEYIVYDDEGHGFTKRKNLLDCYKRSTAFFVEHLKPGKP